MLTPSGAPHHGNPMATKDPLGLLTASGLLRNHRLDGPVYCHGLYPIPQTMLVWPAWIAGFYGENCVFHIMLNEAMMP